MKEMWEKPRIAVEHFMPNEYYARACWGVGCNVALSNQWEMNNYSPYQKPSGGQGGHGKPGESGTIEYYTWYEYNTLGYSGDAHGADHCGTSGNQVIFDNNEDGIADQMKEVGTDGLGDLTCKIFTDNTFLTEMSIADVKIGDTIYWTTSAEGTLGDKIWHHIGTVFETVLGHPNRS